MSEKGGVGPKTHKACARQRQKSGALNTLINVKALHTMSFKFKLFSRVFQTTKSLTNAKESMV